VKRSSTSIGLLVALLASLAFGTSGALGKSLLETGWSPLAAVTFRALIGGVVLAPFAIRMLRGHWSALWHARTRVLIMALVGVAGTQLLYFSSINLIPVSDAVLLEYLAPLLLVLWTWARSRHIPKLVVLIGSVVAVGGLVLVVSPQTGTHLSILGVVLALLAAVGCAVYFVIAAKPSDDLPPVALASAGLVLGALSLGIVGATRILPFTVATNDVRLLGTDLPWWVSLVAIGVVSTAFAYWSSITATEMLGSRLSSFMGLLEVVAAAFYAWILLGQELRWPQLVGGALILAGIALVRAEKTDDVPLEPLPITASIATQLPNATQSPEAEKRPATAKSRATVRG
jgi:drug/metabolite transporter (DMT)-like permease